MLLQIEYNSAGYKCVIVPTQFNVSLVSTMIKQITKLPEFYSLTYKMTLEMP